MTGNRIAPSNPKFQGSPRRTQIHGRRRKGYVLLMTLVSIAIASTVLIGFAQFSLNHALESRMLEEEMQRKWGAASLQQVTLDQSSALLNPGGSRSYRQGRTGSGQSDRKPRALAHVETVIQLGEIQFEVHLHDESSKLDVNQVLAWTKNEIAAKRVLREVVDRETEIRLLPLGKDARRTLKEDAFECWDQILLSNADTASVEGDSTENFAMGQLTAREIHSATFQLTCWSRRLNYQTASDEVLFEFCKMVAGQAAASQLTSFRENNSDSSLNDAIESIHLSKFAAQKLRQVLVESSQSQAIWIHASDRDTESSYLVIRESISDVQRFTSFQW